MENREQHEAFMRIAIELSAQNVNACIGGPFGAIIVKDGKVVAKTANKVTSTNDPTAHAEVSAIRMACTALNTYDLSGCVIYTSCEPCPMCLGAIYWSRIETIYYANTKADAAHVGFDDKFIYEELDKPMEQRTLPVVQMLRDEAMEAFNLWETSPMRIDYYQKCPISIGHFCYLLSFAEVSKPIIESISFTTPSSEPEKPTALNLIFPSPSMMNFVGIPSTL